MRFEDLGLINPFTCLYNLEPVWLLPVVCLRRSRTTNLYDFHHTRDPPDIVFQEETVAIRTQVGHCNASLSSRWRNDASQVVCASDHDFLVRCSAFLPHPGYLLQGFLYCAARNSI